MVSVGIEQYVETEGTSRWHTRLWLGRVHLHFVPVSS
jgi:hypothetical protein